MKKPLGLKIKFFSFLAIPQVAKPSSLHTLFPATGLRVTPTRKILKIYKTLNFPNIQIRHQIAEERAQIHPSTNRREPGVCDSRTERTERHEQPLHSAQRESGTEQSPKGLNLILKIKK